MKKLLPLCVFLFISTAFHAQLQDSICTCYVPDNTVEAIEAGSLTYGDYKAAHGERLTQIAYTDSCEATYSGSGENKYLVNCTGSCTLKIVIPISIPDTVPFLGSCAMYIGVTPPNGNKQNKNLGNRSLIYPNPVEHGNDLVIWTGNVSDLELTDLSGKMVYKNNTVTGNIKINTSDLRKGIYFAKVISENGQTKIRKVVVN